jgi:hypothetical protein
MLDYLHAVTFRRQMNNIFRIHPPCMPAVDVTLVEVTEREAIDSRQLRTATRQECFSIVFRGPREQLLPQGIYERQQDHLGAFALFLVPVGQDQDGVYYEAVFNRLRRQDG